MSPKIWSIKLCIAALTYCCPELGIGSAHFSWRIMCTVLPLRNLSKYHIFLAFINISNILITTNIKIYTFKPKTIVSNWLNNLSWHQTAVKRRTQDQTGLCLHTLNFWVFCGIPIIYRLSHLTLMSCYILKIRVFGSKQFSDTFLTFHFSGSWSFCHCEWRMSTNIGF